MQEKNQIIKVIAKSDFFNGNITINSIKVEINYTD